MLPIPDLHYRQLYHTMPGAHLILLPDLTIAAANEAYLAAIHTNEEDIVGLHYFDIFPPNPLSNQLLRASFKSVERSQRSDEIPLLYYDIYVGGQKIQERHWHIIHTPVLDESKRLLYIIHSLTDTTNLATTIDHPSTAAAEEKLVVWETLFRSLIENSAEGISLADEYSNNIYRSPAAERIMGPLPRENAVDLIHPDDRVLVERSTVELLQNPGTPFPFLARFLHSDGHYIWLEGTFTNLLNVPAVKAIVTNFRDVSRRIEVQVKLKASEQQYYQTLNNMLEGVQIHDFNWRYLFVNKSLLRSARKTREELIGRTLMEEYPGIQNTDVFKAMNRVMKERKSEQMETEFIFPDGLAIHYKLSIEPVPEGIFVLSIDITERKKAEQKIAQSEENLKAIFDNATEGFILTNAQGIIKAFNKMVKEGMLNLEEEIENGVNIFDIVEKGRKDFFRQVFNKVMEGETIQYDKQYLRPDGCSAWINFIFNPVLKNNLPQGVCITGRDITDRKKAEEQLQRAYAEKQALAERMSAILNTLPANIALVDKDGSIIEVNDAWRSFTADGFKGKDYMVGQNYIRVSETSVGEGREDKINMANGLEAVLEEELDEFVYEYSSEETAVEKWYRMIATPLQEEDYTGAVIMHMDISEIRKLEAEKMRHKIEAQKKITQAVLQGQEKERNFIGRELHDNINQILAGTRMYLAIAGNKDAAVKESIRYPLELLDKSMEEIRLLCSNMVTPLQDVKLEDIIRDLMMKLGKSSNIEIVFNYSIPGDPVSDELKLNLYRVLQELGNNIMKYANATIVNVDIWLEKGNICMTVIDNGRGYDINAKRNGIGISNIYSRVQSFNGSIKIETAPGKGTKTIISIPYKN